MLKLFDITKEYKMPSATVQALRGVSLTFRESEFVAILGPSGCGKTTMLNIIGGLDRYTNGDLEVDGISTATFDDVQWDAYRNRVIGFVFQSYNLIPHLSVLENVELALSLVGEKRKERNVKSMSALESVGMAEHAYKRPGQLSGGQAQRASIARAIVGDPKIILADEPTGALDSELSVSVMETLREIAKTRLVIMVTHNAELASAYATRICKFKDGKLVEDTNPYVDALDSVACDNCKEEAEQAIGNDDKSQSNADFAVGDEGCACGATAERKNKKNKKSVFKRKEGRSEVESRGKRRLRFWQRTAFTPTAMSAGMAFGLSMRNLISKKRRTFFTTFAGSIGIISLGLVLSISSGFDKFVTKMQTDMLAGVPVGVYEYNVKASALMDVMTNFNKTPSSDPSAYPDSDKIILETGGGSGGSDFMKDMFNAFFKSVSKNELTEDFDAYMSRMPKEYYNAYSVYYGVQYNLIAKSGEGSEAIYKDVSQKPAPSSALTIATSVLGESGIQPAHWQVLVGNESTMLESYELIGGGRYPKNKNELVLCIDEKNRIDEALLKEFGITGYGADDGAIELGADFFIGRKLKLVRNDDYYECGDDGLYFKPETMSADRLKGLYEGEGSAELEIVGVLRPRKGHIATYVTSSICYTPELAKFVLNDSYGSRIAIRQRELIAEDEASGIPSKYRTVFGDYMRPDANLATTSIVGLMQNKLGWSNFIKGLGVTKAPVYINVFPASYDAKLKTAKYIAAWNEDFSGKIGYFDASEMFVYNLSLVIDLVSVILVAMASISLVVSTVMIGVIASNSVIERTREIGILRSLGARKRDIRNVFVAETSIIGLSGGLIGIILTYALCPIVNVIILAAAGVKNLLYFNPLHAFILVVLSLALTVISGIVPAIGASRKNVVDALRVE